MNHPVMRFLKWIWRGLMWLNEREKKPKGGLTYSQCTRSARKKMH